MVRHHELHSLYGLNISVEHTSRSEGSSYSGYYAKMCCYSWRIPQMAYVTYVSIMVTDFSKSTLACLYMLPLKLLNKRLHSINPSSLLAMILWDKSGIVRYECRMNQKHVVADEEVPDVECHMGRAHSCLVGEDTVDSVCRSQ